jgi:hypothetical protein
MSEDRSEGPRPDLERPVAQRATPASASFQTPSQPTAYYSPPPGSASSPPAPAPKSTWRLAVLGVALAAAVAVGGWYAMAPAPPASGTAATAPASVTKQFSLSKVDADLKATEYLKGLLAGTKKQEPAGASAADPLRGAANAAALKALATTSPKTAADIQSGRSVLYRLYLLDFLAEDGDHVELFVNGVGHGDLYLKNAGKEVLIPLSPGAPTRMKLLATGDGGGGVTVGFVSSLGEARTRIMNVGQSEEWVVTVP